MVETGDQKTGSPIPNNSVFRFNSPFIQVILIGLVCFCCAGMFNALSGMGGGGQLDHNVVNNANTALYTTYAIFGILGGAIYNIIGPRITLFSGCSTYILYAGSLLYYNHHKHQPFVVLAGALLGVGAGLLWAGQGAIMTSYPPAHRKGTYISVFWSIFNMGGVIGGLIPFVMNYHREKADNVNDGTYVGYMVFMSIGTLLSLAILHPSKVIRNDGTGCTDVKYSNVGTETVEIAKLFANWKMVLIFPAAWGSNFFYTYQFNNVNGALFNLRTRGLNNVFYWGAQMFGSVLIGHVMDFSFKRRKTRGLAGISVVAVLGTGIWTGGLLKQRGYDYDDVIVNKSIKLLDFKDSGSAYAGPFSMVYWVIGALADDSVTLSRYVGFYKGVQSAGKGVAWQIDAHKVPYMNQLLVNWALTTISYPLLALLVIKFVKDEDKVAEDDELQTPSGYPKQSNDESINPI
ncbi:putative Ion channel regulatory protein, UNC-93 [Helianthus annuus]|uniref:Ion channel regulatory protein, UNC-93 n=1 Tax=Helianthus annuus TaxID=4232 RepID=A0A251S787_HELAN|nr:putative Ion channel regulatory protein, UNC-93 [Helianthus annuus]KAJ0451899.1 putative Ion channel regulatory protein, UNC-93 [Helianthus annuus]KAJ0456615.1 putative Ion channel regulatory protein, UNC-93 [Helianthus annuus]KAJ0473784.1 putative Ion channel regulatory protein, UNC-93 [Helianthus annuus]KAJ0649360.1 putative Ion channel regulatory protein, UNC-93 [Helianthus annuus]